LFREDQKRVIQQAMPKFNEEQVDIMVEALSNDEILIDPNTYRIMEL
jgi:hypothetical protein